MESKTTTETTKPDALAEELRRLCGCQETGLCPECRAAARIESDAAEIARLRTLHDAASGMVDTDTETLRGWIKRDRDQAALLAQAREALSTLIHVIEQLVPEPSARGVSDVVLFQARSALAAIEKAGGA